MIIFHLLHLRSKFITFMVSQIITFIIKVLLHLWLVFVTCTVCITFMVDFYYISITFMDDYYIYG